MIGWFHSPPQGQTYSISPPEPPQFDNLISRENEKLLLSVNTTPLRNQASSFSMKCTYDLSPCSQCQMPGTLDIHVKPAAKMAVLKVKDRRNRRKEEDL